MPLTMAVAGQKNRIMEVGGKPEIKKHLANLGLVAGNDVTVITDISGNLIVEVDGDRIAIHREMAGKIEI